MKISKKSVQKIEKVRGEERNSEFENIISNTPKAILEGILFSSIPVGIITGITLGVGALVQYITKNNVLQQPFFQAMGYGLAGAGLDFIALAFYSSMPPNGGYEANEPDSAIDEISASIRKRKELKNMTQEEIYSEYLSK